MKEKDFIDKIDCNFPYNNINKWIEIIDESLWISDNAVFYVIHELLRIPKSKRKIVNKNYILYFLWYINNKFSHGYKNTIMILSNKLLNSEKIQIFEIINYMELIKNFKWLYSALNILYFSVDDINWEIEKKYDEVINYWKNN